MARVRHAIRPPAEWQVQDPAATRRDSNRSAVGRCARPSPQGPRVQAGQPPRVTPKMRSLRHRLRTVMNLPGSRVYWTAVAGNIRVRAEDVGARPRNAAGVRARGTRLLRPSRCSNPGHPHILTPTCRTARTLGASGPPSADRSRVASRRAADQRTDGHLPHTSRSTRGTWAGRCSPANGGTQECFPFPPPGNRRSTVLLPFR